MSLRSKISGTTSGSVGTETTHAHTLGALPDFVAITPKANGTVYISSAPDANNIYVKSNAASTPFDAMVMKDHSIIK